MTIDRRDFVKFAVGAVLLPRRSRPDPGAAPAPAGRRSDVYDVAVVGAGVFGAWTASQLQRMGKRIVLLDAYGPANARASSGGESRVIRFGYGPDAMYTRMAMASLPEWQALSDRTELPILQRLGVLFLAGEDDSYPRTSAETIRRLGGRVDELSRSDLATAYPQIALDGISHGYLEPESGALMARRGVLVLVREAVRAGAAYLQEAVARPVATGRRLEVLLTRSGLTVKADAFVFACGPWLPRVFPDLLRDRILPTRQEVFFFGTPAGDRRFVPPALPVWADLEHPPVLTYGMPDLESRGFKLAFDAHGPPMDPDAADRQVSAAGLGAARRFLARRFPALAREPLVETRVCQYENTSNGDFLIDRHPQLENVWLVGGGSGHGFKHGPAVGAYVARAVTGELGAPEPRFSLGTKSPQ